MPSKARLSANALSARLQAFLAANQPLLSHLKITSETGTGVTVTMLRCVVFERFLNLLEEHLFVAKWSNQHDAFKVFLNAVLLGGNLSHLERRNAQKVILDILHSMAGYELKTKQAISFEVVPSFIEQYYPEMVAYQADKTHWWLVFFVQREDDPQSTLGETCAYYLVLIEIHARKLVATADCQQRLTTEVMSLVQQVEKRVREEDQVKKGIFAPVDNYIMVERLRKRTKQQENTIHKKEAIIHEKDATIRENEAALQEKDALIKKLQQDLQKRQKDS